MSEQANTFRNRQTAGGPMPGGFAGRGRGPMGGGHMMGMSGEKPKNFRRTMLTLSRYLKPYRVSLLIAFVLAIVGTVFTIIGPKLLGNATTRLFEGLVAKITNVPGAGIDFA